MIPVEYELGRQYQLERERQAATFRLARRGAVARDPGAPHHLSLATARHWRAWIDCLPGLPGRPRARRFGQWAVPGGSPLDEACSTGTRHAHPAVRPARGVDAIRLLRVFRQQGA